MTTEAAEEVSPKLGFLETGETAVPLEVDTSPNFAQWLGALDVSLVFTAYQSSKLVFVGRELESEKLTFSEGNNILRCMGLGVHASGRALTVATKNQLVRFDNRVPPALTYEGHDAIFAPHRVWVTGYLDTHDVAMMANKSLLFVNTAYSCVATVIDGYSFRPFWQPPFISALEHEDRCHLNGMAVANDRPYFATAVSDTDTPKGWADRMADGGVLLDVVSGATLMNGLSMPHSPRIHNGRLWMLQTGLGALGWVDLATREFHQIAFCPGFARGLAFFGDYAVVCLSLPRSDEKDFSHLPLGKALEERGEEPRCGLMVVDIRNGETVAWLTATVGARELFDVGFLPGARNPRVIDFQNEEINRVINYDTR
ncbi:MAG TPA: TIGR03032 family protein [Rhizomicrobium sp.]